VQRYRQAVLLAEKLGVDTIVDFSGCPGGNATDTTPNWVTCYWPTDFADALKWQWEERLIPYWKEQGAFARQHGIRVAIELHPGFCVYSPENMLRLRTEVGDVLGANYDPSHLFWQGVDNVYAIRYLADAIYAFHAKDTGIDELNTKRSGVLDTKTYRDVPNRSWVFRTVGYGHGEVTWRDIISALRLVGFKKALVIEHEDALMSELEGVSRAADILNRLVMRDEPATVTWA
jgi:sugar phosphate isomerase/epimerase